MKTQTPVSLPDKTEPIAKRNAELVENSSMSSPQMITKSDERFHEWKGKRYPRCTYVLDIAYPRDTFFYQWLQKEGTNAEQIKTEAGLQGRAIHDGIFKLIHGETLDMYSYKEPEWDKLCIFVSWWSEVQPKLIAAEVPVFHKGLKVTGTFDSILEIDGKLLLCDWKSSKTFQDHFHLQTAFYAMAWESMGAKDTKFDGTAILRLGTKHKKGYEWVERDRTEMKKDFELFRAVKKIFDSKVGKDFKPDDKEVPLSLKI